MLNHLETLVNFYPVSSSQTSVKQLLEYVAEHMATHGMHSTIIQHDGIYNLYASTKHHTHSKVLLQGHVDVVPGKQPFQKRGDAIYGRGVYDMLYATAAYMQLIEDLGTSLDTLDLAIMLSGDEEVGGFSGVNKLLNDDSFTTGVCLLPDAGEGFGSLNSAAKGVHNITIRVHGSAHHGSRPWEGDNAARKLVQLLSAIETGFDASDRHNSTMTIAQIQAGEARNQGPASAEATLDIRYKDKQDLMRIEQHLQHQLARYNGEITSTVQGSDYQLDTTNPLVQQFLRLYEAHAGRPIRTTKAFGSSDARFFSEKGIPVIMLRPDGGGAHGDTEWISTKSLHAFYALLKDYVILAASTVPKR